MNYLVAAVAWMLAGALPARADYPDQAIRVLEPFPPGGAVDLVVRLVTDRMAADLGRGFVIESRSGAGGVIATDAVAKSSPDGYTLLVATPNHTILGALKPKLPYDAENDVSPVTLLGAIPMLLVGHPATPFSTFQGLVEFARANPGRLNYSSAGNGTLPHLAMELMLRRSGIEVVHVPYRGAAPAMTDLLAGHVQLKFDTFATSSEHIAAGKLNALAYAALARSVLMPQVPVLAELGLPGFEGVLWDRADGAEGYVRDRHRSAEPGRGDGARRTGASRASSARRRRGGASRAGGVRQLDPSRVRAVARACRAK